MGLQLYVSLLMNRLIATYHLQITVFEAIQEIDASGCVHQYIRERRYEFGGRDLSSATAVFVNLTLASLVRPKKTGDLLKSV